MIEWILLLTAITNLITATFNLKRQKAEKKKTLTKSKRQSNKK